MYPHWWSEKRKAEMADAMRRYDATAIDAKREGSVMCRDCQRQIQRCICNGPNDAALDTGPNDPKNAPHS